LLKSKTVRLLKPCNEKKKKQDSKQKIIRI
jgi:hypothetical protein